MNRNAQQTDLNLIEVLRELWGARFFLGGGLCVGLLIALAFIVMANPKIEARMVIGPAQVMDMSMQARYQDGQNSYMMAQENVSPSEGVSHFTRFEAMMRGVSVSRLLLRDKRIAEGLKSDRAFVFSGAREDVQAMELAEYIRNRVKVDPFGETAMRSLLYRHNDSVFAAYFLQQIHRISDQLIRADIRGQVDQRIAYLERVIAKTYNPDQRRIMTNLLLEQERMRMIVSMDAPVAAMVIEPAASGARSVWPDPYLFYGGLGLLGLMIGYLAFGVVNYKEEPVVHDRRADAMRGEDLQHKPRRPLKYGSWFQNAPDNANDVPGVKRRAKGSSDAAE